MDTTSFASKLKFLILVLLFSSFFIFPCFSKSDIDTTLLQISTDICSVSPQDEIIAVLDFSAETKKLRDYISSTLTSNLMQSGKVRVVTRQHMDKIEKELDFQMSGVVNDNTALSICERLGAQAIVFGQIEELDNSYIMQIKMLDVETAAYMLFKTYNISRSSKTEQLFGRAASYHKTSLGLLVEANKNCIEMIAPAGGACFDYSFARRFALGIKTMISYDVVESRKDDKNSIITIELLGLMRFYIVSPTGEPSSGLFLEGQAGVAIFSVKDEIRKVPSIGGEIGFRIPYKNVYVEPYLRGGYPYMIGAGLNFGLRF